MSLYDLFEHTQLVIVPMVDYLPIPSDPPAPDKWDFWFFAKTFGPSLIAGGIAGMALKVALTQREIAANKYDLDLFDKRYEIFESLIPCYDKINKLDIKEYDDNIINNIDDDNIHESINYQESQNNLINEFIDNDLSLIINKLEKAARIFGNISKDNVKKFKNTIYDFQKRKTLFQQNLNFIRNSYFDRENSLEIFFKKGCKKFHDEVIENMNNNILEINEEIKNLISQINSSIDDATKKYLENNIQEYKKNIENQEEIIASKNNNFLSDQERLNFYLNELKYLVETMYSLKSDFLNMYCTMDSYLSIKEEAYLDKKWYIIPLVLVIICIIIFTFIYNKN